MTLVNLSPFRYLTTKDSARVNGYELSFDGNDYLAMPVPSSAQVSSADWTVTLELYIPTWNFTGLSAVYVFSFGSTDANIPDHFAFSLAENSPAYWMEYGGQGDPDWTDYAIAKASGQQVGWHSVTLGLDKANSKIYFTVTEPDESVVSYDSDADGSPWLSTDVFDPEMCYLGCDAGYYGGSVTSILTSDGFKIRNLGGSFFELGSAYTDIAKTAQAGLNDSIAAIENDGPLAGDITQSTEGNRPSLVSPTYFKGVALTA